MDDSELVEKEIHRLGNVLVPMKSYGPLIEEKMQSFLQQAYNDGKREMSTRDITKMIGENLGRGLISLLGKQEQHPCHSSRNNGWCSRKSNLDVFTKS